MKGAPNQNSDSTESIEYIFEDSLEGSMEDTVEDSPEIDIESLIKFDFTKLSSATGWQNNCGLNCLTHFFAYKLEKGEIQELVGQDPAYIELLKTFQEYYQLPHQPTWDEIAALFRRYPVPTDREAFFAPVLRKHLSKILPIHAEILWNTSAAAAFSDLFHTGRVEDIAAPVYRPNKAKFDEIKASYNQVLYNLSRINVDQQLVRDARHALSIKRPPILNPSEEQLIDQIALIRTNQAQVHVQHQAYQYWIETGVRRYAQYVSDLQYAQAVSFEELTFLCQALQIGLEVYTNDSLQAARGKLETALETGGAQMTVHYDYVFPFRVYNNRPSVEQRIEEVQKARQLAAKKAGKKVDTTEKKALTAADLKNISFSHWEFEFPEEDAETAARLVTEHNKHYPASTSRAFLQSKLAGEFKIYNSKRVDLLKIKTDVKQFMTRAEAQAEVQPIATVTLPPVPRVGKPTTTVTKPTAPVGKQLPPPVPPRRAPTPPKRELALTVNPPLILSGAVKPPSATVSATQSALATIDRHYNETVKDFARANAALQPLLVDLSFQAPVVDLLNRMTKTCLNFFFEKTSGPMQERFTRLSAEDKVRFIEGFVARLVLQLEKAGKNAEAYKLQEKKSSLSLSL